MNTEIRGDFPLSPKRLLVIDDEENMRHMLSSMLQKSGYRVHTASSGEEAMEMVDQTIYDFILCDLKMPHMSGMEFFETARDKLWASTVIMMSAYGSIDTAVEAMKKGAYDFISKPFKFDEVLLTLRKAEERESLKRENRWLKDRIRKIQGNYHFGNMVAKSKAMNAVFKLAEKVARHNTTVMIYGDSGTGKELIARGIHSSGNRAKKPMIPVNCGGIPENLLESELFGYKKGAFTGAHEDKKGAFEEANEGILFLDEIHHLDKLVQAKLMKALQTDDDNNFTIKPVGGNEKDEKKLTLTIILATNVTITKLREKLLPDFYDRVTQLVIELPPLRESKEDIEKSLSENRAHF